MKRNQSTLLALEKLAKQEQSFLASEFVAPHLGSQLVNVQIGQAVCTVSIKPKDFVGWGRFRVRDYRSAKLVRQATQEERDAYLQLLPSVHMLIAGRDDSGYLAVLAHGGDIRFQLATPARLCFAEGLELFDCVVARFDGRQFLFDSADNSRSPIFAEELRTAVSENRDMVAIPGMIPEERWLYGEVIAATREAIIRERRNTTEFRISDALAHAGAVMRSYIERSDGFSVEYTIDGENHTSFVDRDFRVRSAGICLSGHDNDYDLASLVSVIREGHDRGVIHRTL